MPNVMKKAFERLFQEKIVWISLLLVFISMFFVPPSRAYLDYIDTKVLIFLFCFMILIKGFESIGFFALLSQKVIKSVHQLRTLFFALILFTFFLSMWVTNDVALLMMVPFTIVLLTAIQQKQAMIYFLVMETIAANLGSMLTPFGNPQNLYLFSYYHLELLSFLQMMFPVTFVSFVLLIGSGFFVKRTPIQLDFNQKIKVKDGKKGWVYAALFLLCVLSLFEWLSIYILWVVVCIIIFILQKSLFKQVDYGLLVTFLCFFIFIGNLQAIPVVQDWMIRFISDQVFPVSFGLSQLISNVPAAMLVSVFTEDVRNVLLGVNIGGLGTPIASLASLITFKFYGQTFQAHPLKYLLVFTMAQIIFLVILVSLFMK